MKIFFLFFVLSTSAFANVLQGIDRLETVDNKLRGKRVAVLAHFASQDKTGKHLIDKIHSKYNLTLIFSPEHGLRSLKDDFVDDGVDPKTGVAIKSLYKKNKRYPSDEDIENFDVLVIDLKDVGVRFYTYAGTIFQTIKAVFKHGKSVVLLDRVNPIGGTVSGPLLDPSLTEHTISYFRVPQSHGLTIGEYMTYFLKDEINRCNFTVVRLQNWSRDMIWKDTGLPWVSPSPALPTAYQAYLYSIFGSLESLNLSVGRSKNNKEAFNFYGAPWISLDDTQVLTKRLNALKLEGLDFRAVEWTVTRSIYKGKVARGFWVRVLDFKKVNRYKALYKTAVVLKQIFGDKIKFNHWGKRYLGSEDYVQHVNFATPYKMIQKQVLDDEFDFVDEVKPYLFY